MFSSQSAELSLDAPCRAISSVPADRVDNRFLVGSSQIRNGSHNRLLACRFHADVNELGIDAKLAHPTGPIQSITCSPSDVTLVATSTQFQNNATLWRLPTAVMHDTGGLRYDPEDDNHNNNGGDNATNSNSHNDALTAAPKATLEALATFPSMSGKPICHMAWRQPTSFLGDGGVGADSILTSTPSATLGSASAVGDLLTVDHDGNVQLWDVESEQSVSCTRTTPIYDNPKFPAVSNKNSNADDEDWLAQNLHISPRVAWDPHAAGGTAGAATMSRGRVRIFDWRLDPSSIPVGTVDHSFAATSTIVIDVDYNPNKPYVLATSGTDGMLRFWDLRSVKQPLLVGRGGHSHWIWNVQYNPFHDQLVLSTGVADTMVNLWRMSSISSAPLLAEDNAQEDARVAAYEHFDSCYAAAWGAADAWVYTTVGYEGKLVLHHVPSKEKYKILL